MDSLVDMWESRNITILHCTVHLNTSPPPTITHYLMLLCCTGLHCSPLLCSALLCSALHVLPFTASHGAALHHPTPTLLRTPLNSITPHCTMSQCRALHCINLCFNTPQLNCTALHFIIPIGVESDEGDLLRGQCPWGTTHAPRI